MLTRRRLIQSGLTTAAAVSFGPPSGATRSRRRRRSATDRPVRSAAPPDANGILLPPGFSSRVIARSGEIVPGTGYRVPGRPRRRGRVPVRRTAAGSSPSTPRSSGRHVGGASAIRFDADGTITAAYRILEDTQRQLRRRPDAVGRVALVRGGPARPGVGVRHRPDAPPVVAPGHGRLPARGGVRGPGHAGSVYLSEDVGDGGLYRFTPTVYPDLSAGTAGDRLRRGVGTAVDVEDGPRSAVRCRRTPLRDQVPDSIKFARGEGIWFDSGLVYLATTTDETIHVYDTNAGDARASSTAPRTLPGHAADAAIDNMHVTKSGDLLVAEDSYGNDPDAHGRLPDHAGQRGLAVPEDDGRRRTPSSEVVRHRVRPRTARACTSARSATGHGHRLRDHAARSGPIRPTVYPGRRRRRRPRSPTAARRDPTPPAAPTPGVPIGLEVDEADRESDVHPQRPRARLHARQAGDGPRSAITAKIGNRTKTLAHGHAQRRSRAARCCGSRPSKAAAKLLRARRKDVKATVEIRDHDAGRARAHVQADGHPATVGGCA